MAAGRFVAPDNANGDAGGGPLSGNALDRVALLALLEPDAGERVRKRRLASRRAHCANYM